MLTATDLQRIGGARNSKSAKICGELASALPQYLPRYDLEPPHRLAMFLAQIAHESAHFQTTTEYASGAAYEGRKDLGNTQAGDGKRYKGRGLIQLTGRANYRRFGRKIGMDLEGKPATAAQFPAALLTALEYWQDRNLNSYADNGDFLNVTRRINGGYNGMDDRYAKYGRAALVLLGLPESVSAFQRDNGLLTDGVVGPATVAALHKALKAIGGYADPAPVAFMPREAEELIEDSDKGFLESNTDKANMIASAGGLGGIGSLFAYVQDWRVQIALIVLIGLVAGAALYIFASRRRKANLARKARVA